jgi:SAM-dependent methyltransferase
MTTKNEPDWNQRYRGNGTPWEKGYGAPPLEEFLRAHAFGGTVLVPGCGHGHDVRLLAKHGARAVGLDIAPSALEKARGYPGAGEESYHLGDFFALENGLHSTFDGVFEHTCFCAIHPSQREDYVQAACTALKPRGLLLAIFFLNIEDPEGPPFPVTNEEIDKLFGAYFQTLRRWLPKAAYPGREGREEMRLMRKIR